MDRDLADVAEVITGEIRGMAEEQYRQRKETERLANITEGRLWGLEKELQKPLSTKIWNVGLVIIAMALVLSLAWVLIGAVVWMATN